MCVTCLGNLMIVAQRFDLFERQFKAIGVDNESVAGVESDFLKYKRSIGEDAQERAFAVEGAEAAVDGDEQGGWVTGAGEV